MAYDVHTFWPVTKKWSPSSTARVVSDARSEPAFGSLIPMHHTMSPRRAAGASFFCSSVPNSKRLGATIAQPGKCTDRGRPRAAISSWNTSVCTGVALRPPSSGGYPGTIQPWSNRVACQSLAHLGMPSSSDAAKSRPNACLGAWVSRKTSSSALKASSSGPQASLMASQSERRDAGVDTLEQLVAHALDGIDRPLLVGRRLVDRVPALGQLHEPAGDDEALAADALGQVRRQPRHEGRRVLRRP